MSANSHSENPYGFGPYLARQNHAFTQLHGRRDPFQYQSEHTHDPRRQQDPQQYTSQLLNGVYQRQNSRQSPYEPAEQYQPRPVYFNQFGVVENYNPSLDGTTSTPGVGPSQHPTARYHPPMHSRPTYLDPSKPASLYNRIEPEFVQCPTTKSAGPYGNQHDGYYIIYSRYRRGLRETNENTSRGRLAEAGESLLEISEWLLSNAEGLDLTKDNQATHSDRLKLWQDFKYCWLAILTRQLDDTRRVRTTSQDPARGQSVLSKTSLQHLGDELISLCDNLEKVGLVDYEMGVWEEEIITLLLQCWEVANAHDDHGPAVGATQA